MNVQAMEKAIYDSHPYLEYICAMNSPFPDEGPRIGIESHESMEVYFCREAPVPLKFDFINSSKSLYMYEALFIPADCPHRLSMETEKVSDGFDIICLRIKCDSIHIEEPFIVRDQRGVLEALFFTMSKEHHRGFHTPYLMEYYLKAILTVSIYIAESKPAEVSISSIVQYIRNHYSEHLTLDLLADLEHISKTYLCQVFKRHHGCTVNYYINQVRIEHARQLLSDTDMSIEEIAYATGFETAKYFSQVFRRYTNELPSHYRKEMKGHSGH